MNFFGILYQIIIKQGQNFVIIIIMILLNIKRSNLYLFSKPISFQTLKSLISEAWIQQKLKKQISLTTKLFYLKTQFKMTMRGQPEFTLQKNFIDPSLKSSNISIKKPNENHFQNIDVPKFNDRQNAELKKIIQKIKKLNSAVSGQKLKVELIEMLKEIIFYRQNMRMLDIEQLEKSKPRHSNLNQQKQKQSKQEFETDQYRESCKNRQNELNFKLVEKIQQILVNEKKVGQSQQVHLILLELIQSFKLEQFYIFYLEKLFCMNCKSETQQRQELHSGSWLKNSGNQSYSGLTKDKQLRQMLLNQNQVDLTIEIIDALSAVNYVYANSQMPFYLQKHLQSFFGMKLAVILQMYSTLSDKLGLLLKIEKIFKQTHLVYNKQLLYKGFIETYIGEVERICLLENLKDSDIDIAINFFVITVENLILDKKIISRLNETLTKIAINYHPPYINAHRTHKIMVIYQKIGGIPEKVYQNMVSKVIRQTYTKNQYFFVQTLKFYVYAQCQDLSFLQQILMRLPEFVNSSQLEANIKSKHLLHFLIHYLCIKQPIIAKNLPSKQVLMDCPSYTKKDIYSIKEIMKIAKQQSQSQNKKKTKNYFVSPCIQKGAKQLGKANKDPLASLQEDILKSSLEIVIKELNQAHKEYYQIIQKYSFCSFQLDFVVLRWESRQQMRLLGYLGVESVGLQYCYDGNDYGAEGLTDKKIKQMSLIEYEKQLIMARNKQVRSAILKHYGWKIICVANKFLYKRYLGKRQFQQKIKQAIFENWHEGEEKFDYSRFEK